MRAGTDGLVTWTVRSAAEGTLDVVLINVRDNPLHQHLRQNRLLSSLATGILLPVHDGPVKSHKEAGALLVQL